MTVVAPHPWHGDPTGSCVVFGVRLSQDARVVAAAASLTHRMGASLVCVWVDPQRVIVERGPDGTVVAYPVEVHQGDEEETAANVEWLTARLTNTLESHPVPWRFVYTAGDPAQQLHQVAEEVDAVAIALATREAGTRAWVVEKAMGAVAEHLAHHQHRPVIVFPLP